MRALITGAGGFVGTHLCSYLLAHTDWQLLGTVYPEPVEPSKHDARLRMVWADLRDSVQVVDLVESFAPDLVFHLAAQSFVPASLSDPWGTLENNIHAQLNVLEAVRQKSSAARVLIIGSNEEYGQPEGEMPIVEESALRPTNPYAVSKLAQDFMGLQYHLAYGIEVVRLRPFNHTGPGQSPRFVVPAFASQIADIEAGLQEPIVRVGNLDAERDFTDVRDVVRGYFLAATKAEPDVYNLASGSPRSVRSLLETLLSFSDVEITVEIDPARYRPVDVPVVYGSAAKFHSCTGWKPEIPFEQTLRDVLDYFRERAGQSGS